MFDIVGLGENSIDEVYRLPAMPQPGTGAAKIRIREHTIFAGGQVATTMVACAALGLRAKYIGVFGNDDGGRLVRRELDGRGVDHADVCGSGPLASPCSYVLATPIR